MVNTIRVKAGTRRRELELHLGSETALRLNLWRQQVALLKEMAVNKAVELGKHWVGHSRVWASIMGNKKEVCQSGSGQRTFKFVEEEFSFWGT